MLCCDSTHLLTNADGRDKAGREALPAELHDEARLADGRVPDGEDLEQQRALICVPRSAAALHSVFWCVCWGGEGSGAVDRFRYTV